MHDVIDYYYLSFILIKNLSVGGSSEASEIRRGNRLLTVDIPAR